MVSLVPLLQNLSQRRGVELDPVQALLRLVLQVDVHPGEVGGVVFTFFILRRGEPEAGVDRRTLRTTHRRAAVAHVQVQPLAPPRLGVLKRRSRQDPAHPRKVRLGRGLHGLVELGVEQTGATLARRTIALILPRLLRFLRGPFILLHGLAVVVEEGRLLLRVRALQRRVLQLFFFDAILVASAGAKFL